MMRIASLLALVMMGSSAASQFQSQPDSLPADSLPADSLPVVAPISPEDSARYVELLSDITAKRIDTVSIAHTSGKSPGLALLFSAVLPGAGQFYNESYWKVPILLGFGYYFASQWVDANDSVKHYRRLFTNSISPQQSAGNATYSRLREDYKNIRDTFSWYIFIYYIVNLVDAYVDASLYDFNVGDDLSIRVRPEFDFRRSTVPQLSIEVRF